MYDIRFIQENAEMVRVGLKKAGADPSIVDEVLAVAENLKQNPSKELEDKLYERLSWIRNLPDADVPEGLEDDCNVVERTSGELPTFSFTPRPHWEIAEKLGILDIARGQKVSGPRFYFLMKAGAMLQRALLQWMLDLHVKENGYTDIIAPALVQEHALFGSGYLPKSEHKLYRDEEEKLWLSPTAEVPLTSMYKDEVLDESQLPIKYAALTTCFRREREDAGKDLVGLKRGHQFEKIELLQFIHPKKSDEGLLGLVKDVEKICQGLEIPYRVLKICAGKSSFVATTQYDVEVWAPGITGDGKNGQWMEVSSCSNIRDFQARRVNTKFQPTDGGEPEYVHTINGSGVGVPRLLIAVLENYQNEDGTIRIPEVLKPYCRGMEVIS